MLQHTDKAEEEMASIIGVLLRKQQAKKNTQTPEDSKKDSQWKLRRQGFRK
jgi:hypothetical protein